jgi:hypothetical protein
MRDKKITLLQNENSANSKVVSPKGKECYKYVYLGHYLLSQASEGISENRQYCYDLMGAAYDAGQIWRQSRELGHVPIIDRNPRNGKAVEWLRISPADTMSGV